MAASLLSRYREKISQLIRFLSSSSTVSRPSPKINKQTHLPSPLEKKLDACVPYLGREFTSADVDDILRKQTDPDLAFSIFCRTSLQLGHRHCSSTYHTMLHISISSRRFSAAESLISEVLSGATHPDLPLLNSAIRFCCSRRHLFSRAFDLYRLTLLPKPPCCPSLETFTLLLAALLKRIGKPPTCYIYLDRVRSLDSHMKTLGVAMDSLTLNLMIKAYSICLDMDEAVRVFHEMGIYGCQPNQRTYECVVQGFCEKGLMDQGFFYFRNMRCKRFVPTRNIYMIMICSLAVEGKYDGCVRVLLDMLGNSLVPSISTYSTILYEMRRGGKAEKAFGLLKYLERMEGAMDPWVYSALLMEMNSAPKSCDLELLLGEDHWC